MPVKFLILCVKEPRHKSRLIEFSLRRRNAFIQVGATARQRDERNHVETFLLLSGWRYFREPRKPAWYYRPAGRQDVETSNMLRDRRNFWGARESTLTRSSDCPVSTVFAASVFSSFGNNNLTRVRRERCICLNERDFTAVL